MPRWGSKPFSQVHLGDQRRTQRLIQSAAHIASHPERSFTQTFTLAQLKGFYRLCDQKESTWKSIQTPHWNQTRQVMSSQPLVLILHDTTELGYTTHHALTGVGPIGDGKGRGFLQHNSLAVVPEPRQVLGLADQQLELRREAPDQETAAERRERDKESRLWIQGIQATGRAPDQSRWVDVGDRGADISEAMRACRDLGHDFLFRVAQDREVWRDDQGDNKQKLQQFVCSLPSQGGDEMEIPGRGGRPSRKAKVQRVAAPVGIPAPQGPRDRKSQPVVPAWVIRVWESDPPSGVEGLDGILATSVETVPLDQIRDRRDWYGCRWMVEVFHHIEKTGCREEERRFETAARMEACLAVLALVAVRVFQMRTDLESRPTAEAEEVAIQAEIEVVKKRVKHSGRVRFPVKDFVRGVARRGGFLGRNCDGEPGVQAIGRGYQRLQDLLLGYQLRNKDVGNK